MRAMVSCFATVTIIGFLPLTTDWGSASLSVLQTIVANDCGRERHGAEVTRQQWGANDRSPAEPGRLARHRTYGLHARAQTARGRPGRVGLQPHEGQGRAARG